MTRLLRVLAVLLLLAAPAAAQTIARAPSTNLASNGLFTTAMATPGVIVATPGAAGTLNNGTYGFRLVAVDPAGNTTTAGPEVTCTTVAGAGAGSCALSWTAVPGAGTYRVYGQVVGAEDRYTSQGFTTGTSVVWTTPGTAIIAALPTVNTAKQTNIGPTNWFGTSYFYTDNNPFFANLFWGNIAPPVITVGTAVGNLAIGLHALQALTTGINNTAVGWDSQFASTTGCNNTSLGEDALKAITAGNCSTTATNNVGVGYTAGINITTGANNIAIGPNSLNLNQTGNSNVAVGINALNAVTTSDNTAVGLGALQHLATGTQSTAVGQSACATVAGANGNMLCLGYGAGFFETGTAKLFIDNAVHANEADARIKSMVYGVFSATPATQFFNVNANLNTSVATQFNGVLSSSATAPTVTSAGTSPSITGANGTSTFRINVGTGGTATTIVLALPTATTGWNLQCTNLTGAAANRATGGVMVQQSSTASAATVQYQTLSTGAALAFTASDIVSCSALAF